MYHNCEWLRGQPNFKETETARGTKNLNFRCRLPIGQLVLFSTMPIEPRSKVMKKPRLAKMSLALRFYLALAVPLILISIAVTFMTFKGLRNNATDLAEFLRFESKTNRILSLLLVQDDASKAMLIDPGQLETFSAKKIEAYDELKQLITELQAEAEAENVKDIIKKLQEIDEQKLRPIDSLVLEKLFEDVDAARKMYFDQYEVEKHEYEGLIRKLAEIGTSDLKQATESLHSKNMQSMLQIGAALLLGILVVMITITILSRQVERSEENIKSLLAVLNEGLFFFDSSGHMPADRTESLSKILPESSGIKSLQDFFEMYTKTTRATIDTVLELLWPTTKDDFYSDPATTLSMLPHSFKLSDGRIIHLEYRLLLNAQQVLSRVVVVVADVTQKLKDEREAVQQAERVRKVSRVAANFENYFVFLDEAIGIFKRADGLWKKVAKGLEGQEIIQLKRDLHTLKGSLGAFEFTDLATRFHALESSIEELGLKSSKNLELWDGIKDQWKFETTDIEQVLGLQSSRDKVAIQKHKFEQITAYAKSTANGGLLQLLEDSLRYPLAEAFSKYEVYLTKLSERSGEKQVKLAYASDSSQLSPQEVQKLDGILVHIFRNCLDHGIEDIEGRKAAKKPQMGQIQIACYRQKEGGLHLVIKDDGQGINAEKLAQKAVKAGIWSEEKAQKASFQDKVELVFVPQLSTKDSVTEISGRGVGMDAVKSTLVQGGGRISIYSQAGVGTQFEIDVPARFGVEKSEGLLGRVA